jgi:hypothetical protein
MKLPSDFIQKGNSPYKTSAGKPNSYEKNHDWFFDEKTQKPTHGYFNSVLVPSRKLKVNEKGEAETDLEDLQNILKEAFRASGMTNKFYNPVKNNFTFPEIEFVDDDGNIKLKGDDTIYQGIRPLIESAFKNIPGSSVDETFASNEASRVYSKYEKIANQRQESATFPFKVKAEYNIENQLAHTDFQRSYSINPGEISFIKIDNEYFGGSRKKSNADDPRHPAFNLDKAVMSIQQYPGMLKQVNAAGDSSKPVFIDLKETFFRENETIEIYDEKTGNLKKLYAKPVLKDEYKYRTFYVADDFVEFTVNPETQKVEQTKYMKKEQMKPIVRRHLLARRKKIQENFVKLPYNQKYFKDVATTKKTFMDLFKKHLKMAPTDNEAISSNGWFSFDELVVGMKKIVKDILKMQGEKVKLNFVSARQGALASNVASQWQLRTKHQAYKNEGLNFNTKAFADHGLNRKKVLGTTIHEMLHNMNVNSYNWMAPDHTFEEYGKDGGRGGFNEDHIAFMEVFNTAATISVAKAMKDIHPDLNNLEKSSLSYLEFFTSILPILDESGFLKKHNINSIEQLGDWYIDRITKGKGFDFYNFASEELNYQGNPANILGSKRSYNWDYKPIEIMKDFSTGEYKDFFKVNKNENFYRLWDEYMLEYGAHYRSYYNTTGVREQVLEALLNITDGISLDKRGFFDTASFDDLIKKGMDAFRMGNGPSRYTQYKLHEFLRFMLYKYTNKKYLKEESL